ncbi:c-type cytochrome [Effusibacillus lacus]|uniref:C cytochrome n=1 Tax=Effusibacillus lacus TaxID=1348429 RepID=A0A292YPF3_9BACL|nr:c-type cytochrome [Effusibacillus lacus]TCS72075.1 thiosulfate dehydrogenase [Effusibacillus lacus]GAX90360.1 C cytochrome [Effusibacillus lacus]
MEHKHWKKGLLSGFFFSALIIAVAGCSTAQPADKTVEPAKQVATQETKVTQPKVPTMDEVPKGPEGEAIKLGYKLMNETNTVLKEHVGNQLSCSSCHGAAGTDSTSSLVGVTAVYPKYISRAGKVLTIEDRINGCFQRSMNGKPLAYNSDEMRAMVAYLTYISKGVPTGTKERPWVVVNDIPNPPTPNKENGEKLYKQACASCHGADGSGTGPNSGPALWGKNSFNIGAGMARLGKAAGYIQRNMPLGEMGGIKQGTLTEQQAADLAAYILSQERPDFGPKANDWPNGDAPKDVPYETNAKKAKN